MVNKEQREFRFDLIEEEEMNVEQLEKPITYDVKHEAEKIPATEKSSEAAEDKEKGVVADASGGQVNTLSDEL